MTSNALPTIHTNKQSSMEEVLISLGVSKKIIDSVLLRVKYTKENLPAAALDMGLISPEIIAQAIAKRHGHPYMAPSNINRIDPAISNQFPLDTFGGFVPIKVAENKVIVAVDSMENANRARHSFHEHSCELAIASGHTIQAIFRQFFSNSKRDFFQALDKYINARLNVKDEDNLDTHLEDVYCTLLRHACYYGASDIYIWRSASAGMIRLKKDGRGELLCAVPLPVYESIINALVSKVSQSDKLKREPQEAKIDKSFVSDAKLKLYYDVFTRYNYRVQLYNAPDTDWTSTVIRVNDGQSTITDFKSLDFDAKSQMLIKEWLSAPTGLILVTGPTGSGKTTTLYSMLKEIDPIERPLFTVENPVEYRNGMWVQKVMASSGDRDEGEMSRLMLKSLLREAPSAILYGELRDDKELATNIMNASNTGHLVFTTLHTNSASRSVLRLLDMGVNPQSIAACLLGVIAVRLVGLLCEFCKEPDDRESTIEQLKDIYDPEKDASKIYKAVGCPHCNGHGYRGRKMLYEIINGSRITKHIQHGSTFSEIEKDGLFGDSMWSRGLAMVANGSTSIDEVKKNIFNPHIDV